MLNVWLKIRKRDSLEFVLKHLNFWIKTFSNTNLYKIWLYNENIILPNYFKKFTHINYVDKKILLLDNDCKYLHNAIYKNNIISNWWKPAAFALSAPYFYLKEDQYLWNIDADDLFLEGPAANYITKVEEYIFDKKLYTLSYDMLFSYNGKHAEKRNHWTFGMNISSLNKMRWMIANNLNRRISPQGTIGVNLDLIIDNYLESITPSICFVTPYKLHHMNICYTKFNQDLNMMEINDYGSIINIPKHHKTVVIS